MFDDIIFEMLQKENMNILLHKKRYHWHLRATPGINHDSIWSFVIDFIIPG